MLIQVKHIGKTTLLNVFGGIEHTVVQVYVRFLPTSDRNIFERLKQLLIIKIQQVA
ncbi:MAG: hypothetical protein WCC10_09015 [Tumebacillaceae bacterium]